MYSLAQTEGQGFSSLCFFFAAYFIFLTSEESSQADLGRGWRVSAALQALLYPPALLLQRTSDPYIPPWRW